MRVGGQLRRVVPAGIRQAASVTKYSRAKAEVMLGPGLPFSVELCAVK